MLTFAMILKRNTMKRISIYLMMLLLCAASCNKDNGNSSASGTDSGAVVPQPDPDPDPDPAEIDFDNIDPQDPHYKDNRGSGHSVNGNRTGTISGTPWSLEQWAESSAQYSMTYYDNGTFKANWSNCSDYLVRVGFKYNNSGIDPKTKNHIADYKYTKTGNAGYGYIGAYGWTNNPIVEFYIVDDWYGKRPPYSTSCQKKGELTVDGATYDIYTDVRTNAPSPYGAKDFLQIFSVRQSARQQGRIHISAHFGKWEELGLQLGKLTEVSLLTEAGTNATGSVEYTYFNLMDLPVE